MDQHHNVTIPNTDGILKGVRHEILDFRFFHESVFAGPLSKLWGIF